MYKYKIEIIPADVVTMYCQAMYVHVRLFQDSLCLCFLQRVLAGWET